MEPASAKAIATSVIVLRVVVRATDLDGFITHYSRFIDGDRIFIFTKTPQKPGTRVRFSLHLENGEQLIHGKGTVTRIQEPSAAATRPPGMELVFVPLDERSQTLIDFMLATRAGMVDDVGAAPAPAEVAAEPSVTQPPPLPTKSSEELRAEALKRAVLRNRPGAPPPVPSAPAAPPARIGAAPVDAAGWEEAAKPEPKVIVDEPAMAAPVETAPSPGSAAPSPAGISAAPSSAVSASPPSAVSTAATSSASSASALSTLSSLASSASSASALSALSSLASSASSASPPSAVSASPPSAVSASPPSASFASAPSAFSTSAPSASSAPSVVSAPAPSVFSGAPSSGNSAPARAPEISTPPPARAPAFAATGSASAFSAFGFAPPAPASEFVDTPTEADERAPLFEPLNPPGPTPSFAEGWREPLPPGQPGADPSRSVPANPFSEVSDGAIDYFVEWSLEQSIGPRREATASFSNIEMELPRTEPDSPTTTTKSPPTRRRAALLVALGAAAGMPLGALAMWALRPAPRPAAPVAAALPPAPAAAPAPPPPAAKVELAIDSRPPGALVTVDDEPKGATPLTLQVAPGAHRVQIAKERYATADETASAPGRVQVDLKRPVAVLEIASQPPGATVVVAGEQRGHTPAQIKLPAFEKYDVQVALGDGKPWRKKVYLKAPSLRVVAVLARQNPKR